MPPQARDDSAPDDTEESSSARRSRIEQLLRETIRKAIERGVEAGVGTLSAADKTVRNVTDLKVPRELVSYVFSQVDETKNGLLRVVAKEVHDFLEATDVAGELQRALTALSFEVKTEIRFIPNDKGGVKPSVKTMSKPKVRSTARTRRRSDSHDEIVPPPLDDEA